MAPCCLCEPLERMQPLAGSKPRTPIRCHSQILSALCLSQTPGQGRVCKYAVDVGRLLEGHDFSQTHEELPHGAPLRHCLLHNIDALSGWTWS